jgi:hypothetical protein
LSLSRLELFPTTKLRIAFTLILGSCLLSTASPFVSLAPQSKVYGIFSTVDDVTRGVALIERNLPDDDDDWLRKQFLTLEDMELPGHTARNKGHDWFSDALTHGSHTLVGLQIEASNEKPTSSILFGILPDLRAVAPPLGSFGIYQMAPVHQEPSARLAIAGEKIEWFSQGAVDPFPLHAVANHNRLENGNNEWLMQTFCEPKLSMGFSN